MSVNLDGEEFEVEQTFCYPSVVDTVRANGEFHASMTAMIKIGQE